MSAPDTDLRSARYLYLLRDREGRVHIAAYGAGTPACKAEVEYESSPNYLRFEEACPACFGGLAAQMGAEGE